MVFAGFSVGVATLSVQPSRMGVKLCRAHAADYKEESQRECSRE